MSFTPPCSSVTTHTQTADDTVNSMIIYSPSDVAAPTVSCPTAREPDQSLYEYVISNYDSDHVLNRLVTTYRETLGDDVALTGRSLEVLNRVLAISVPRFSPRMPGAQSSAPSPGPHPGSRSRESSEILSARTSKQPARSSRHRALADITNTHREAESPRYDPGAIQSTTEDTAYEMLLAQYEEAVSQPPRGSLALSKEKIDIYLSNLIERPWAKENVRGHQPDKTCNLCTLVCRPDHESIRWTDEDLVSSDEGETEHWLTRQQARPGSIVAFDAPRKMTADEHVITVTLHHTLNGWRSHSPSEFPYLQSLIDDANQRGYGTFGSFCNEPWATSVMHTHYHLTNGDLTEDGIKTEAKNAKMSGGIPPAFYRTLGDDMMEAMNLVKRGVIGSLWEYRSRAQLEDTSWGPFFDLMLDMEQAHTEKRRPEYEKRMRQEWTAYERRKTEGHTFTQADFLFQP